MRVISQGGEIDVPYDLFVFGITIDNRVTAIRDSVARPYECTNGFMAKYSTKEKALKAMEMLREQYSRIEIIKALASGTCEHMEESLKPEEFEDILKKYINMEVFQFPKDDDERLN